MTETRSLGFGGDAGGGTPTFAYDGLKVAHKRGFGATSGEWTLFLATQLYRDTLRSGLTKDAVDAVDDIHLIPPDPRVAAAVAAAIGTAHAADWAFDPRNDVMPYWTGLAIYGVPEIAGNVWGCITFWDGC